MQATSLSLGSHKKTVSFGDLLFLGVGWTTGRIYFCLLLHLLFRGSKVSKMFLKVPIIWISRKQKVNRFPQRKGLARIYPTISCLQRQSSSNDRKMPFCNIYWTKEMLLLLLYRIIPIYAFLFHFLCRSILPIR